MLHPRVRYNECRQVQGELRLDAHCMPMRARHAARGRSKRRGRSAVGCCGTRCVIAAVGGPCRRARARRPTILPYWGGAHAARGHGRAAKRGAQAAAAAHAGGARGVCWRVKATGPSYCGSSWVAPVAI